MEIHFIEAERDKDKSPTSDWFEETTGAFLCPSLGLLTIASLTPDYIRVKIIDEKIDRVDVDNVPDAVAISFKTMSSLRAYALADAFRQKKTKVILGGLHASLLPEEAKLHCDSVVVGEAEEIWPMVLNDLKSGSLRPFYHMPRLTDLSTLPTPKFGLLDTSHYLCHAIQASRGCSLDCDFCPTREMFGGVFRLKPIARVVNEIKTALAFEKKYIFFTDDIFCAGDERCTLELLKEIKKLKIEFFIVSDFLVLTKNIVIALAQSGCRYLGLNLPGTCSSEEVKAIKMIQMLGIDVWGYFMFGFKFHEKDVFRKAYDFTQKTKMKHVSFTVMAPYPNTIAGKKLDSQGRILNKDWPLYDQAHIVFKPEKMSHDELEEGFRWIKGQLGSLSHFNLEAERRPPWKIFTGRCLAGISAMLPMKSRKNSPKQQ